MAVNSQDSVTCDSCVHSNVCGKLDRLKQIHTQVRNFTLNLEQDESGSIVSNKETKKLFKSYEENQIIKNNGFKVVVQCKDYKDRDDY